MYVGTHIDDSTEYLGEVARRASLESSDEGANPEPVLDTVAAAERFLKSLKEIFAAAGTLTKNSNCTAFAAEVERLVSSNTLKEIHVRLHLMQVVDMLRAGALPNKEELIAYGLPNHHVSWHS